MTIQIEVTRQGNKKIMKDGITGKPRAYATKGEIAGVLALAGELED